MRTSVRREDLRSASCVERQVAGVELERLTRRTQPRQMRLLRPTRRDQLRTWRYPCDHDAEDIVAPRILQFVEVVKHDHERFRTRPECGREPRRRPPQRRYTEASDLGDQVGGAVRDPHERRREQPSRTAGSLSKRSSETQAMRRSSVWAHCVRNVDLPYPAGAVTPTTRHSLPRAFSIRSARLTESGRGRGTASFASTSNSSSATTVDDAPSTSLTDGIVGRDPASTARLQSPPAFPPRAFRVSQRSAKFP